MSTLGQNHARDLAENWRHATGPELILPRPFIGASLPCLVKCFEILVLSYHDVPATSEDGAGCPSEWCMYHSREWP